MHIPHILIQFAVLIIFIISAYRTISSLSTKMLLEFLFNASVAIIAFAYLLNDLNLNFYYLMIHLRN